MADQNIRTAVEGISPPEKEKHQFFIDVQPVSDAKRRVLSFSLLSVSNQDYLFQEMGTTLRARARVQINLAVSQVIDIKQVANFPDIIFPILWFEEGVDGLPDEVTNLMLLATQVAPKARSTLMMVFFIVGALLLIIAVTCLVRRSHRQSTLHLASNYLATAAVDQAKKKSQNEHKRY